jgi:glycosyltransferase involved in cell wall biosynthesis
MQNQHVNILLATYNGSRFLKQQLDSLIAQTYEFITIYIRDDGSSDNTIALIQEYIQNNTSQKQIILLDNGGKNLRCPGSFYQILRECQPADYYAFCDQDDIWYPDKIQWAVDNLSAEANHSVPLVYFSGYEYYTDEGVFLRHSPKQKEVTHLHDVLYYTPASGFVLVFNESARQKLIMDIDPGQELHDRWLLRGASCFGKIIYDPRYSATHIRHADAVTAEDSSDANLFQSFIQNEINGTAMTDSKEYLRHFYTVFEDQLSALDKKTLALFIQSNSFFRQIQKLFYPHSLRARLAGEIAIRILFLLNRI